ncbi:MAG: 4-(cytidine 5'-diphospho)-2-C-methyl-D-erythritol kinase [Alicyclobacillus sp.]|nr:4-(cytidine 5'-diphospho)-2-C-methyl-D-erythritol kinase [Alicyclobacillus sp.]
MLEHAYAKINLTLDVLGRRPDGYHEVDMVMQTVDLSDLVWLEETDSGRIELETSASHIPSDERNLAYAAAEVFRKASGVRRGVRIRIDKVIPVAAGLGGGSADAAAVLRGLNRMWGTGYNAEELARMGAEVGSDVPFCVHMGCAVVRGRGERLQPVVHPLKAWVVLIHPPVFVSTAEVYAALQASDYTESPRSPKLVEYLQAGDLEGVQRAARNGLAEPAMRLHPEIRQVRERVQHLSPVPVHMSGSGPTLFCLLPARGPAHRLWGAVRGFTKDVFLCRFC